MSALDEFLSQYPVVIDINIHWGDMDAFGHVNNVMYFRYFESARIAYMAKTHIMDEMKSKMIGPILASTECRYKRPVVFPDTLKVGARVAQLNEQDFIQEYAIFSMQQQAVVTLGQGRIVMVDYKTHQKTAVSDTIKAAILKHDPHVTVSQ